MKARSGQIALYLMAVLIAIALFAMMDVSAFLAVRAKNRTTNAGDAAALAVARLQGDLLATIGKLNVAHLKAAISNDAELCRAIVRRQREICLLGPLEGLAVGSDWARRNGITRADSSARETLRQHVADIRTAYAMDPEQYPESWEGAWEDYATALEAKVNGDLLAVPGTIDFLDAAGDHILLNPLFYDAIAGRNWCWFHFHASGLLEGYTGFTDFGPLPAADDKTRQRRCCNSEIYSLHLEARAGKARDLLSVETICELTGEPRSNVVASVLLRDESQVWFYYGSDFWRRWWEIDPEPNEYNEGSPLPVVGQVRPEYDVRGCAAICTVSATVPDLAARDDDTRTIAWPAAAKPFGLVLDDRGELKNGGFVAGVPFDQTRLVPLDSVGGLDLGRPNLEMVRHVRYHLPVYLQNGPSSLDGSCFYCRQLREWEQPTLRATARDWLKVNSQNCARSVRGGHRNGGSPHAH